MSFHKNTELHIKSACLLEYDRVREEHGDKFNSMHEGYAILKEEVEEAESEFEFLDHYLEEVWESVKKNEEVITPANYIQNAVNIKSGYATRSWI